jgi:hypothetical protein
MQAGFSSMEAHATSFSSMQSNLLLTGPSMAFKHQSPCVKLANLPAEIRQVVKKQSTQSTFRIQIMACTGDDNAVGYLNEIDKEFNEVDCTDDYYSERAEVIAAGRFASFTHGDWCLKAMLGPVSSKFDCMDEKLVAWASMDEKPACIQKPVSSSANGATSKSSKSSKSSFCVVM